MCRAVLELPGNFSRAAATGLHLPKGFLDFWGTSFGRCSYSLWLQFVFASLTKVVSGCLQQCLCLPYSLSRRNLDTHISGFQLVYLNVLWFTVSDNCSLILKFCLVWFFSVLRFFLFPCFEKAFKKCSKYLQLCVVNVLRMAVNLSLKAVYKTAETQWWCCQDNENSEAFLTLYVIVQFQKGKCWRIPYYIWQIFMSSLQADFWLPTLQQCACSSWAQLSCLSPPTHSQFCQLDSLMVTLGVTPVQTH